MRQRFPFMCSALVFLAQAACTGEIAGGFQPAGANSGESGAPSQSGNQPGVPGGGPSGSDSPGAGPGSGDDPGPVVPGEAPALDNSTGPAPLRRLSRLEYNNTVRDLLGDSSRPADKFAGDFDAAHSGFVAGGVVSTVDADRLLEASESLAAAAVSRLTTLVPCNPVPTAVAAQDTCARTFIADFAARAFRRPIAADELPVLVAYYTKVRNELKYSFPDAIRMIIQVTLQSPNFLYHWQLGATLPQLQGGLVRFNDHEIAARLSYFLWASMPDKPLRAAADAGQLRTIEQVELQARRMLADAKSRDMLADFQQQWLATGGVTRVQKDATTYPGFNAATAASMLAESNAFVQHVLGTEGDGGLDTLLTAPFSFLDANTAKVYQQAGVSGPALRQVNLDAQKRAGLLTQPAFLATHAYPNGSHPVMRGKQVLEKVLCIPLPIPPADIPEPKPAAANLSTRARFEEHGNNACARACHALMDPLGFAFEHYDGMGTFRANDGGQPVNAAGTITLDDKDVSFVDAIGLMRALSVSDQVRACMTTQFLRYALKRKEEEGDAASLAFAQETFSRSGFDLREALVAAAKTRSFFFRKPAAGEVLQ